MYVKGKARSLKADHSRVHPYSRALKTKQPATRRGYRTGFADRGADRSDAATIPVHRKRILRLFKAVCRGNAALVAQYKTMPMRRTPFIHHSSDLQAKTAITAQTRHRKARGSVPYQRIDEGRPGVQQDRRP